MQPLIGRANYGKKKKRHKLFEIDKKSCPRGKEYRKESPKEKTSLTILQFSLMTILISRLLKNDVIFNIL